MKLTRPTVATGNDTMTTKDQILDWARANYSASFAAQTVVECWDDEDFEAFASLQNFLDTYATPKDDQYKDVRAAGGVDEREVRHDTDYYDECGHTYD